MEANGQRHISTTLTPVTIKYEAGCVSETVWTLKTEKRMVPKPGIETLSFSEQNMVCVMNRTCGDVHILIYAVKGV
jgi:hypothetical protein